MANTLDLPIQHKAPSFFGRLTSQQAFWVFVAVIAACVFLTFATNSFATPNNLFNVTRNFTFVAVIALGTTIVIITGGIDLSVGSVLCLCSMILAEVMHAGYSIEVGIAASLGVALLVGAFNGILIAYLEIPPFVVTLGMLSIARSLAMVASNNTVVFQFGPDHDKLLYAGRRCLPVRHFQPGRLYSPAGAHHRLCTALDPFWPICLCDRRQRKGRNVDRCAGSPHQGCGLYDFGSDGRYCGCDRDRLARRGNDQSWCRHGVAGDCGGCHRRRQSGRRYRYGVRRV